ncbi:hypothetical protein KI387_013794 [Taxus chinensis]|uniref:Uncharacterized protein n=1 Tax=Taxus chinensis TaxID=29808 RepID=A0AA38CIU9_TAXCH|nr:hypothetical protein KI387_013794 [Taxus chinensis]
MNLNHDSTQMVSEMVLACSPSAAGIVTVWDLSTGLELLHFHGCSSPRNAITTIGNDTSFFAASQVLEPFAISPPSICFWTWSSPQIHHRIFPSEQIGPLACTSNGVYLAGGGYSGQIYIWELPSGQLTRSWHAHKNTVRSLILSDDESLLVSSGDDGFVSVWPLIRILDIAEGLDGETQLPCLYSWAAHSFPVTGIASGIGGCNAVVVSCSLDCTLKIWSLGLGTHLRTLRLPCGINSIVVDPFEHALYAGGIDGRIYVAVLKVYFRGNDEISDEDGIIGSLFDHNGPITALSFRMDGTTLVSASEDCTICLWDTCTNCVVRMFNYSRGPVINILVLPLLPQVSSPSYYGLQFASHDSYVDIVNESLHNLTYPKDMPLIFLPKIERASIDVETQCHSIGIMERRIKELEAMKANLVVVNEDRRRA